MQYNEVDYVVALLRNRSTGLSYSDVVENIFNCLGARAAWEHVWVPIEIEELGDDSLVDHVVGQVLDVLEIGLPRASGQGEDFAPST